MKISASYIVSFFKSLAIAGVSKTDLLSLDGPSIIRIEKKLIAEQRLNNSLSKNDIEQIIQALKNYTPEIVIICNYECLYGMLTGTHAEYIDTIIHRGKNEVARLKYVLSDFFRDDLIALITRACQENNWNDIRVLLHYRLFLTDDFINIIKQRLSAKLDYALMVFNKKPTHRDLRIQLNYLNQDLFELLGEIDDEYFDKQIFAFLSFITGNEDYTKRTIYFNKVIKYFKAYNSRNYILRSKVDNSSFEYGFKRLFVYASIAAFFLLFFGGIIYLASRPVPQLARKNYWATHKDDSFDQYTDQKYWAEEQKIQMENFIEARLYSLNYPFNSWKTAIRKEYKYQNPFDNNVFSRNFDSIRVSGPGIQIFNQTYKECIILAYYYPYNIRRRYFGEVIAPTIHALYLPPGDSLRISLGNTIFRFYMGKRLASFNSYKNFVYADSTDVKFSKFTSADSMLLSKGFNVTNTMKAVSGNLNLVIQQSDPRVYRILWNGTTALQQVSRTYHEEVYKELPDSATYKKPLVLDIRKTKSDENETLVQKINSFLPSTLR